MDVVHCIVLTFLFKVAVGKDILHVITDNKANWTTATQQCKLASPDLIFTSVGIAVDISLDIEQDVWVDYYQAETAFEYLGCAVKDNTTAMFYTQADPGQCMSACGAQQIIGIFGIECFCFATDDIENDKHTMMPFCNKKCTDRSGIVCGGPSKETGGTTYISLYRSIGIDITSTENRKKYCMYYDSAGFNWGDCLNKFQYICGKGSSVWIESSNDDEYVFRHWADATVRCFTNNTRPSTYNNTRSLHTTTSSPQLWTGVVRSQVIYKYTNDPHNQDRTNTFGYLTRDINGGAVLRFTSSKQIAKKSLCVNDTDASETSSPVSIINDGISTSAKTSSVRTENTSLPKSTLEVNTDSSSLLKNEGGDSDVGAIVGVSLSVVVAGIFIVICLVMFVRKRLFHQPCRKKDKQASPNMVQNHHGYVNTQFNEMLHNSVDANRPEYAETDEATLTENGVQNDSTNNDTTTSPVYSNDYFVIEKKACESTKPGNLNFDPNQPYEKLHFEKCQNYENNDNAHT